MNSYAEYGKRAVLCSMTVMLDGKRKQTAVALHGAVASLAWDACESLADTPEQLEADGAVDILLKLLDHWFRFDTAIVLSSVFEEFFFRSNRRVRESTF